MGNRLDVGVVLHFVVEGLFEHCSACTVDDFVDISLDDNYGEGDDDDFVHFVHCGDILMACCKMCRW